MRISSTAIIDSNWVSQWKMGSNRYLQRTRETKDQGGKGPVGQTTRGVKEQGGKRLGGKGPGGKGLRG